MPLYDTVRITKNAKDMKVQTAQISAVILPNKKRPDGTCPIAIRVNFHGRAMKTLTVSAKEKDWDSRTSNVRKSDRDYALKNHIISDELHQAEQNRLALEASGKPYRAKDVLASREKPRLLEIDGVCERMMEERCVRDHTRASYRTALKKLKEYYGDNVGFGDIDSDNIVGFGKWLAGKYRNSTILTVMRCIATIFKYAAAHGVISDSDNPFRTYKYTRMFKSETSREALSEAEMAKLEGWYSQHFFVDDSGSVAPVSADVWNDMLTPYSELCTASMFLASYYLQGLSTVDMVLLKASQFREKKTTVRREEMRPVQVTVDGVEQTAFIPTVTEEEIWYWDVVDVKRRKTGQPVPIAVEQNYMSLAVIGLYLATADERGGYVFPLTDHEPESRELDRICERFSKNAQKKLRRLGQKLQIKTQMTPYIARHTFATHMLQKGATAGLLASAMGRTVENIDTYIHQLDSSERLLAAKR